MLYFRKVLKKITKINNTVLFLSTFVIVLGSSIIMHDVEPETFPSVFDAFWWVMTTMTTVGYGDFYPVSVEGRIYAIFLYIIGIGLLGIVIGKVVDFLGTYKRLKEEGKLKYKGKNHIVIIGWSKKADYAINEILKTNNDIEVVLVDELTKEPLENDRVHYIQGDATMTEAMEMANIKLAKSVIIFSDDSVDKPMLADGKTMLLAASVEQYAPEVKTIVEIAREEHVRSFSHVKVDEFILSNEIISKMAVKTTTQKGITNFFEQLLSHSQGDDLFEIEKKPEWKTYRDALEDLNKKGVTVLSGGEKINIYKMLDDAIPENEKIRIICDNETYKKII